MYGRLEHSERGGFQTDLENLVCPAALLAIREKVLRGSLFSEIHKSALRNRKVGHTSLLHSMTRRTAKVLDIFFLI
jgi:hypothetical protein